MFCGGIVFVCNLAFRVTIILTNMTHLIRLIMRSQEHRKLAQITKSKSVIRQFRLRSSDQKSFKRPLVLTPSKNFILLRIFKLFGDNPSVGRSQMIDGMNIQHLPVSGNYMNVRFNPSETPTVLALWWVPSLKHLFRFY